MAKEKEYNHVDAIGRPLKVGDPVAAPSSITTLMVGKITAIAEKKVRIVKYGESEKVESYRYKRVDGQYVRTTVMKPNGKLRYPSETVLLDGPDILMYLLKLQ